MEGDASSSEEVASFRTRSATECSVYCLRQPGCESFNACPGDLQGYPVTCELFKKRVAHPKLIPSLCRYYEREHFSQETPLVCENGGVYLDDEDRCKCVGSYAGLTCQRIMRDCSEGYIDRVGKREQYFIQPKDSPEAFEVHCNNQVDGGMTYIMHRTEWEFPRPDFYQNWQAYKEGFGTHYVNAWIGNEHLHQITRQGVYELEVGVARYPEEFKYLYYEQISVGNESERYALHLGPYFMGSFDGDSLTPSNDPQRNMNGKPFSTYDDDVSDNCAATLRAGWWFAEGCTAANLHGPLSYPNSPRVYWQYPFGTDRITGVYMQIKAKSYYSDMP
ncbi:fibrinogen-like protein A [Liolophura sinensis]|uniref:fibrinogen-like protein A n=1 Tax=Liolophura sinensis TaxID=3198878 RepID=UPI0031591344